MGKGRQGSLGSGGLSGTGFEKRSCGHLGRGSARLSHFQVIVLGARTKWRIRNALLQVAGFDREVFLRTPAEYDPSLGISCSGVWLQ